MSNPADIGTQREVPSRVQPRQLIPLTPAHPPLQTAYTTQRKQHAVAGAEQADAPNAPVLA